MRLPLPRSVRRAIRSVKPRHAFLRDSRGVIHVGANSGQERELYEQFGLAVLWIEPIPELYARLRENIAPYPRQRALQQLVTDRDDERYAFNVSDNDGASSSILPLELHKAIWPTVGYARTIELPSVTLATLVERERIDRTAYDALVLDTQGSELLVLQGAESLLGGFRHVKAEVADFEAYKGCCRVADVDRFLARHGFRECHRRKFATKPGVGSYFDLVYRRG
jgi:FkbM family methyltransferase